ncbi:hypothetical protein FH972_025475 [Carpinus fangiana]|uniref:Uncharacterized protein n=1 Tax=Carpinus fangiana TaxID=176857 RepID=A0A5N6L1Q9_9ROSI|nr:hypothetical protein FH972_025475 [Carpinus fangiana]
MPPSSLQSRANTCGRCLRALARGPATYARATPRRWTSSKARSLQHNAASIKQSSAISDARRAASSLGTQQSKADEDGYYVTSLGNATPDKERVLLQPDNLFHSFSDSPSPDIRRRAAFMKQHAYCPHPSHQRTRQVDQPGDPEDRKPQIGAKAAAPAHVKHECPDCGIPVYCCEEHWMDDFESHLEVCHTLREINEDDHDLRSGRFFPEFSYPGSQRAEEFVLNMSNWDTFMYTRDFAAVDEPRNMRQVTRLLTYPTTVASVLHELSPYNIRNKRLTNEGLRSFAALRYSLHPPAQGGDTSVAGLRPSPPPVRIFILGARAESSLPRDVWIQLTHCFPRSRFHLVFIGPESMANRDDEFPLPARTPQNPFGGIVEDRLGGSMKITTFVEYYHTMHQTGHFAPYDPYFDVFMLFHPGLGHPASSHEWEETLPLLLETKCPVICTGYTEWDMERDRRQYYLRLTEQLLSELVKMVFTPPSWVPQLPFDPPDTVSIADFMLDDKHGRHPLHHSRPFFTCGLSGKEYTAQQYKERVDLLARGICAELGWAPNKGSEWDKVVGVFAPNTIDSIGLAWAIHSIGGIDTPANAAYVEWELEHQMKDSGAKCIFTAISNLEMTLNVAKKLGIPKEKIFLLELPKEITGGAATPKGFKTIDNLIEQGRGEKPLEKLKWEKGEGKRRTAFLCYSSGTSGLPKGVMISHRNVIANTIQIATFDSVYRNTLNDPKSKYKYQENALGLLPMSHIYGLVVICHATVYQGDGVIVLPKFEMASCLSAIQDYKINVLFLVPPIIINMVNNKPTLKKYDLSHVKSIFTGAAPLGRETADSLQAIFPDWKIRQGYGLTETCTVVCSSIPDDIWFGSCGSLLPGVEAKIMSVEGQEITGYDQPGELLARSPSVTLGYLNNEKANKETYVDGYMRTGDEAVIRKSPNGHEHIFIVDRIKELIKVKGLQVAPAELEACILSHPAVADVAVIQIPDEAAGERPKAYVVLSPDAQGIEDNPKLLMRDIMKHVEKDKARHKWIKEVEFIDAIPKSPSGKILRRFLRDQDRKDRAKKGPKL